MADELRLQPGPGGWVAATLHEDDELVPSARAFVQFGQGRAGRWEAVALLMIEPSVKSLRSIPIHRIEVAVNADDRVSKQLHDRLDKPVARLGLPFLRQFQGYPAAEQPLRLERPASRRLNDAWYKQVANTYRQAAARGLKPRKAIAETANVSQDVAGRWVYEARKRGFLPRTSPGKVTA
jgi:hypothetical protein